METVIIFFPQDSLIRNNADLQGLKSDVMLGGSVVSAIRGVDVCASI